MESLNGIEDLPYFAEGEVVPGFGRGSKELGIPTANFPEDVIKNLPKSFECGVYYGWAKLSSDPHVYKMTMCVGWNPYYQNTVKTMETHIIHKFDQDFYGDIMKIVVVGYVRPMCDFPSLEALIEAIHNDNAVGSDRLDLAENQHYRHHQFFLSLSGVSSSTDKNMKNIPNDGASEAHKSMSKQNGHISNPGQTFEDSNDQNTEKKSSESIMLSMENCSHKDLNGASHIGGPLGGR